MQVYIGNAGPCLFSFCFHIGYYQLGNLHPTWDLRLNDFFVLFPPQLQFILVTPSTIKGRGVVKEYICSCADVLNNLAIYHSTPLGLYNGRPRCS